jgi:tRNA-specific 2-thiouridylase
VWRDGGYRLLRGVDPAKDQSYVLHMLGQDELARVRLPVGEMTKAEVRSRAASLGLRTAAKPESQEVCFVLASGGRAAFLAPRTALRPGTVVDTAGRPVGKVEAVELVTVGQRRGLGLSGGARRYAVSVDPARATVVAGTEHELLTDHVEVDSLAWVDGPVTGAVTVQCGAHARPVAADFDGRTVRFAERHRRVAPGQSVVLYRADEVVGGGTALPAELAVGEAL